MVIRVEKIISDGQTGADEGALVAAKRLGLETGGFMPRGFITENGNKPEYEKLYGMKEDGSPGYPTRTRRNIGLADATFIFGNIESPGSHLSLKFCEKYRKPRHLLDWKSGVVISEHQIDVFYDWLYVGKYRVLNVAGNRESTMPGIKDAVIDLLIRVFQ